MEKAFFFQAWSHHKSAVRLSYWRLHTVPAVGFLSGHSADDASTLAAMARVAEPARWFAPRVPLSPAGSGTIWSAQRKE